MSVIGKIIYARTAYLDELTRFDSKITRLTRDEELVAKEIRPSADEDFYDVTEDSFLDWAYTSVGDEVVTLRVTTADDTVGEEFDFPITIIEAPPTFASDEDLLDVETELLDLLKEGTSSFLKINIKATKDIIDDLAKRGIRSYTGERLTYSDLAEIEEVNNWAIFKALSIIFESNVVEVNDTYSQKANYYREEAESESQRSEVRFKNEEGAPVSSENFRTASLGRG